MLTLQNLNIIMSRPKVYINLSLGCVNIIVRGFFQNVFIYMCMVFVRCLSLCYCASMCDTLAVTDE